MSRARDLADGTFSGAFAADSPTLVVDDTNNRVGVGTAGPAAQFDLTDSSTNQPTIRLSTATAANNLTIGRDSSTGHYNFKSDEAGSSIQFYTDPDGTGPVNRLSINRYGYITTPNQPLSRRMKTTSGTVSSGVPTQVDFDTNIVASGITYSSGNFTVPVAGKYFVTSNVRFNLHPAMNLEIGIQQNGTTMIYNYIAVTSTNYNYIMASTILNMAASDYFSVYTYQGSGSTQTLSANSQGVVSASAFLIG